MLGCHSQMDLMQPQPASLDCHHPIAAKCEMHLSLSATAFDPIGGLQIMVSERLGNVCCCQIDSFASWGLIVVKKCMADAIKQFQMHWDSILLLNRHLVKI